MAKGVKKIKWADGGIIKNESTQGISAVIEGDKPAYFLVDEWIVGTTDKDRKNGVTWFIMSNDRKQILSKKANKPILEKFEVKIPKKQCGPYTYYIEASLSGELDRKKIGMHVKGYCPPKVLSIEWSNKNGSAKSGSTLMLADNSPVNIKIETEGVNGITNLIVEVYKEKSNSLVHTISNVAVVDGIINASMPNAVLWKPSVNNSQETENFYVKLKNPISGSYVPDGNSNFISPYGQIGATSQFFTYAPQAPSNQTPLKVGSVKVNYDKLYTCRYDKLIISDTDTNKDKFDIEVYDVKKNKTIPKYDTLAGSSESTKKELKLNYKSYSLKKCFSKTHKQEVEIFVDGKKQGVEPINGETAKINLMANTNMALLRASPEIFFVTPDKPTNYKIYAKTCVQPVGLLDIDVYPNVERELAFILTMFKTKNWEINVKKNKGKEGYSIGRNESVTEYNGEKGLRLVDRELEILHQDKGGLGFGFQAKVKVDETTSSIELGRTKSQIKELISFFNKVELFIKELDGRGKEGSSLAFKGGCYPKATFDIEPPNVALALRMTNRKVEKSNKVVTEYSGGLALKPIVGLKVGVDILTLVQYMGFQGKVVSWLVEVLTQGANVEIYFIIEVGFQAKAEFNLAYNEIEGLKAGTQKFELEGLITGKAGIKSKTKEIVTIIKPDGSTDKAEVEKWKAEGGAAGGLIYTYEVKGDSKGLYSRHKLEFTGIKATLVVYVMTQQRKFNEYAKKEFTVMEKPQQPIWKSDKDYFK